MKIFQNLIKNSKFKFIIILSFLLSLYIYISASSYVKAANKEAQTIDFVLAKDKKNGRNKK